MTDTFDHADGTEHICHCAVSENTHTPPTEGVGIPWGMGGSMSPKHLKKCMDLEFPEGWGSVRKNPFCGGGMDVF